VTGCYATHQASSAECSLAAMSNKPSLNDGNCRTQPSVCTAFLLLTLFSPLEGTWAPTTLLCLAPAEMQLQGKETLRRWAANWRASILLEESLSTMLKTSPGVGDTIDNIRA
jgi:hypothetical protein